MWTEWRRILKKERDRMYGMWMATSLSITICDSPLSLGYAYPRVDEAIIAQLKDGITFSMMHELEVTLAELVHRVIPNANPSGSVRRGGCDQCRGAVARAYTGRSKVLCCGYHGWHDWYIGVTSRNAGIRGGKGPERHFRVQ